MYFKISKRYSWDQRAGQGRGHNCAVLPPKKGGLSMQQRFTELRCKEVVNICDGSRLGYVSDVVVELPCGRLVAMIVPGPRRFFGLFCREYDYCIPWKAVKQIGDDIILVEVCLEQVRSPLENRKKLFEIFEKT